VVAKTIKNKTASTNQAFQIPALVLKSQEKIVAMLTPSINKIIPQTNNLSLKIIDKFLYPLFISHNKERI
jgi:hypothetical protein